MTYDFNLLPNQQPRNGADIVNEAIAPRVLNSAERQNAGELLLLKNAYENAETDAQRQAANDDANLIRQAARNAGLNLSDYGENVSLQDAKRNLMTNDARALVDLMQGQFSLPSQDYYEKTYRDLMAQGYSSSKARNIAGGMTQTYKGDRTRYLDDMLAGYGYDGRVMTRLGQQIVAQLAAENPISANLYANTKINPSQADAYNVENALARLAVAQGYDLDRMAAQFDYNTQLAAQQGQLAQDNATHQSNLIEQREINREKRAFDLDEQTFLRQIHRINQYLPAEDRQAAISALFNYVKGNSQDSSKETKDLLDSLDKTLGRITAQRKAITDQYSNNPAGVPQEVQSQIAQLDEEWNSTHEFIKGIFGVTGNNFMPYTGYEEIDNQTIEELQQLANGDYTTFREYLSNWLDASAVTPRAKEQIMQRYKQKHN